MAVVADGGAGTDKAVRAYIAVLSDYHRPLNVGVSPHRCAFAYGDFTFYYCVLFDCPQVLWLDSLHQ
jgi:hypothetical protein